MVEIVYQAGSLFDAPKGSLLVHACNCQGVWGRGIATNFKKWYPAAFADYREYCITSAAPGQALIIPTDDGNYIGCLFTSYEYNPPDARKEIVLATGMALVGLQRQYMNLYGQPPVYSNKFNSGLFKVPWEKTEKLIQGVWDATDTWTVFEG